MKIVVASSGLGHVARGIEAWAADLGRALHERGVDVTLCKGGGVASAPYERVVGCWQRGSVRAKRLSKCLPRRLSWRLGLASTYGVEQVTFALNLIRYLRSERVDLLHVQDPLVAIMVQRARRLGLVRTRTILAHGTEEPVAFLRKIDHLQHLAPWHEQECRAAGVSKPAWTTIPNFIDCNRFAPGDGEALRAELGIPRDALVVLTAAAIKRTHKRIDALLDEVARLREADPALPVWLVVAGGREADTDELEALGARLLGDRVRFLVRFPRERMADLYRAADVFVLTSLKEMMPIAVLEASASGLPCIVHRHPVLQWMVGPGGEPIDMAAPGELASTLGVLLRDTEDRKRLGLLARRHCLKQFGESAVVERIISHYRSVLSDDPRVDGAPVAAVKGGQLARSTASVSVVIPTFNSASWVTQAIDSVLTQTSPPDEIIVVDDGSTDDTRSRLAPYRDRVRYVHQENRGVAAARNRGIAASTGDMIAFLDADDIWHPRKLELQLQAMTDHPGLGLLGTASYDWPGPAPAQPESFPTRPVPLSWRRLAVRNALTTSSVVVRRAAFERVGVFDPELRGPEDFDLWLRIAEVYPVANLPAPLVGYRTVPGSLGSRPSTMEAGLRRVLRKLDDRRAWKGRWLLRRKAHSYCDYSCAYLYGANGDQRAALGRIIGSLARYPLPYRRADVRMPFARVRMLSMILRRSLGSPDRARAA